MTVKVHNIMLASLTFDALRNTEHFTELFQTRVVLLVPYSGFLL